MSDEMKQLQRKLTEQGRRKQASPEQNAEELARFCEDQIASAPSEDERERWQRAADYWWRQA